jgi:hypothetical protein
MQALTRTALVAFGLICAFERAASACPFCGGKGASGLLENRRRLLVWSMRPDASDTPAAGAGAFAGNRSHRRTVAVAGGAERVFERASGRY